jgi:REP element-mobilizing transposase RayT
MIFRCHARKSRSFKQLLLYMNAPQEKGQQPVFHNLITNENNVMKIANEFMKNSSYIKPRQNGVVLYHHILSLSSYDKEKVTEQILNNIAHKYLDLCASEAKAYALSQFNTENPHIHLMISANKFDSSEKIRISKKEFFVIRREMDRYLEQNYPELTHSLLFTKQIKQKKEISGTTMKVSWYEQEREKRLKRAGKEVTPSKKQLVRDAILTAFSVAMDSSQFVNLLKEQGLTLYKRGQSFAVMDNEGMKFRLSTLGLEETLQQNFQQWAAMPKRAIEEQRIEFEKLQRKIGDLGFRQDIQLALQQQPPNEIDLILQEQRQKKRDKGLGRKRRL